MTPLTPLVIFGLGLVAMLPCLLAHVTVRLVTARWTVDWLTRHTVRSTRQVEEFAASFERKAAQMTGATGRLSILPGLCAVPAVAYAALAVAVGPMPVLWSEVVALIALAWLATAPLLGVRLLAASLRLAAARARRLLDQAPAVVMIAEGGAGRLRRAV